VNRTILPWTLQLRDADTLPDGVIGQIDGRAVPYDTPTDLGGITETFARGAVDPADLVGAPLLWQHQTGEVIGRITAATNRDDGVYFTADVIDTARGRDAHVALRTGAVAGLSVGFEQPDGGARWKGNHVTRTKVRVREVSAATLPAYPDAATLAVRNREEESTVEITTPEVPQVDLTNLATREDLTALESRMSSMLTVPAPSRALSVREALVLQLTESGKAQKLRALDDVVSSGNAGILPPDWSREVRDALDTQRYAFPNVGAIGFPTTGYTLTIPKITQHTEVAARGTEKTQVPSQPLTTSSDTYTAAWYAGAVDVALELIWQSDPSVQALVVDSLLGQYAAVTDQALTLALETSATPTETVLDFTDWGSVSAQIIDAAETIRAATGMFGDRLMLTTASWKALIGLMDAEGRRVFAPGGPANSDGTAALLARSINIGGVYAFHNPRSVEDAQFNTKAARVGEKTPVQLQSDNVTLAGRDFGIIGAFVWVPAYPAGILVHSLADEEG
jgi:HK97 family phage prohead protease